MDLPDDAEIPPELLAQLSDSATLAEIVSELRAQLASMPERTGENLWPKLRRQLEAAALIEPESIPGVNPPYLRFHPTLAPMLWAQLDKDEKARLTEAYRGRYYALARFLYRSDTQTPDQARAIARRELPNLLHAVREALDAGDPDAVDFVERVNRFLTVFAMPREAALHTLHAKKLSGESGSKAWFLAQSNHAEQLLRSGKIEKATEIFSDILDTLGEEATFERAHTLCDLGRCYLLSGRPTLAEIQYRDAITVNEALEQSAEAKNNRGMIHADLGMALTRQHRFAEAREQCRKGLETCQEVGNLRNEGSVLIQLGTLALEEGDLSEAVTSYRQGLELFQRLNEPLAQSAVHHQLGIALQKAEQWDEAETHLRQAANLSVIAGPQGAAGTWGQLALLNVEAGRLDAAETWLWKVIEVSRQAGDKDTLSKTLSNLASLLKEQPGRLTEARKLAEESIAIRKTLDLGVSQIWKTYDILAGIADKEGKLDQAAEYRRLGRDAKRAFAGTTHEMRQFLPFILGACQAIQDPGEAVEFHNLLAKLEEGRATDFVEAIRRILAGERNRDALCDKLDADGTMLVETILEALENPAILQNLLPGDEGASA
jgi:tetratricopeptide (TPR) repeat protein